MELSKLPVPGGPTIWITVGQGPNALAVGAGGGCLGHFYSDLSFLSSLFLSLGSGLIQTVILPLSPKPTKQPIFSLSGSTLIRKNWLL